MQISQVGGILGQLLATIVGGSIVIFANWLSTRTEKQEAVQNWYEQTYIAQGIDPLITYFLSLEFHLRSLNLGNHTELPDISLVPVEALTKVQILLDDQVLTSTTLLLHEYLGDTNISVVPSTAASAASKISIALSQLRKELLKNVSTKVSSKSYQVDVSHITGTLSSIFEELNDIVVASLVK